MSKCRIFYWYRLYMQYPQHFKGLLTNTLNTLKCAYVAVSFMWYDCVKCARNETYVLIGRIHQQDTLTEKNRSVAIIFINVVVSESLNLHTITALLYAVNRIKP